MTFSSVRGNVPNKMGPSCAIYNRGSRVSVQELLVEDSESRLVSLRVNFSRSKSLK